MPAWKELGLWPRPKDLRRTGGRLRLKRPLKVEIAGAAGWLDEEAGKIVEMLNRAAGQTVADARARGGVRLTLSDGAGLDRPEGCRLSVSRSGVRLAADDARGLFYGAGTLAQLLRPGPSLECVECADWPRHSVRGIHLYLPARRHLDFFTRFLDFMARGKFNTLFLEIGGGMEYQRHPEINAAWKKFCKEALAYDPAADRNRASMTSRPPPNHPRGPAALQNSRYFPKDSIHPDLAGGGWLTQAEIRRIAAECAARHVEIVPEVQSLSHSYYLCMAHPEIAERPRREDPWPDTYCPSNPASYALLGDVLDEVIRLFNPRAIHIGHDEAYTFRVCPKCRKRAAHDLLAGDVLKIHDFLAARGVRTWMWGDKLMVINAPGGRRYGGVARRFTDPVTKKSYFMPPTWKAAERMPKDLLIGDWYWILDRNSAAQFRRRGLELIYGNFAPFTFENWRARSGIPGVLGAEVSTWCGVTPYEFGHNGTFAETFAGADMLWSGAPADRKEIVPLIATQLTREVEALTGQDRRLVRGGAGKFRALDISAAAVALPQTLRGRIKSGRKIRTPFGDAFDVLASAGGRLEKAIVLRLGERVEARIAVGSKAERLALLHTCTLQGVFHRPTYYSYHRKAARVLDVMVVYADGTRKRFGADFGDDIGLVSGAWPDRKPWLCFRAVPLPVGEFTFYAQEWANPRPEAPIAGLILRLGPDATDQGEVLVIAAASANPQEQGD